MKTQNYSNHAARPPTLFFAASSAAFLAFVHFGWQAATDFSTDNLFAALLAATLLATLVQSRAFGLGVQDRVIRNEERARLSAILPEALRSRIGELTTDQLIGLRFASDAEVAELVERVLDGELTARKEIKQAVRDWKPDHERI